MTAEEMERLAKYATDSYFVNLSEQEKREVGINRETYLRNYIKTFEVAKNEILKSQSSKFEEFGTENSRTFK